MSVLGCLDNFFQKLDLAILTRQLETSNEFESIQVIVKTMSSQSQSIKYMPK